MTRLLALASVALLTLVLGCTASSPGGDPGQDGGPAGGAGGAAAGGSGGSGGGSAGSGGGSAGSGGGSAGSGGGSAGSGGGSAGSGGGGGTVAPESYSVSFGPVQVAPGMEDTQCVVLRLHNPRQLHIGSIHNVLGETSHHLIVYRVTDTVEQPVPFSCQPFADTLDPSRGAPLVITQKHDDTLLLPEGVGFTLEQDQMIRLEMHYINVTGEELPAQATATFTAIPDAAFRDEASFLFIGNPDIDLPVGEHTTLGPSYFELPASLADAQFFGITGHTHRFGTDVFVATAPSAGGADTPVYDVPDWRWSEPETVYHDPPFQVPAGGGFRFTCEWTNTSNARVTFGESATKEMCFYWAYYYPSQGAFVCFHTDQVPGGYDFCCPGNALCSQILE